MRVMFLILFLLLSTVASSVFAQAQSTISFSHAPFSPTSVEYVVFQVIASDPDGIQSIAIYIDGTLEKTCSGIAICQVSKLFPIAGPYTYYARVTDLKEEITDSSLRSFTVSLYQSPGTPSSQPGSSSTSPNTTPLISVSHFPVSPSSSDSVVIQVNASDPDGVKAIRIYVDGAQKNMCLDTISCNTVSEKYAGIHTYYAQADDYRNGTSTSATQTFSQGVPAQATTPSTSNVSVRINELLAQIAQLQKEIQAKVARPVSCSGLTFSRDLMAGSSGADVKCLQVLLNREAVTRLATTGAGASGYETLYFGSRTHAALVKFQEQYASEILTPVGKMQGTGIVDSYTRIKLNLILNSFPR